MGNFRQQGTTQLFVAYGRQCKGKPILKQRLSKCLVECIKFTYSKNELLTPVGVKGHHTRKMAVTYADMAGAEPPTICNAATWSSSNTFAKFNRLSAVDNSDAEFGRRVLTLTGPTTPAQHHCSGYCIPLKHNFCQ